MTVPFMVKSSCDLRNNCNNYLYHTQQTNKSFIINLTLLSIIIMIVSTECHLIYWSTRKKSTHFHFHQRQDYKKVSFLLIIDRDQKWNLILYLKCCYAIPLINSIFVFINCRLFKLSLFFHFRLIKSNERNII